MLPIIPGVHTGGQVAQPIQVERQSLKVSDTLTVECGAWEEDLEAGTVTFSGGVVATYGKATLRAPGLVVHRKESTLVSTGRTTIEDDLGHLAASSVRIVYEGPNKGGEATDVTVTIGHVLVTGQKLRITESPDPEWVVEGGVVALKDLADKGHSVMAKRIRVYPGKYGVAESAYAVVFGQKIGPIPHARFNLDRRISGFRLPTVSNRHGTDFGFEWQNSYFVATDVSLGANVKFFPGDLTESRIQLTYSGVKSGPNAAKIAPSDDLAERFSNGWLDSIVVSDPSRELERLRQTKRSLTIGTSWNEETRDRRTNALDVSKLVEVVAESGGPLGGGAYSLSARGQRIRPDTASPWTNRAVLEATYRSPSFALAGSLTGYARADFFGTASPGGSFGFGRVQIGVFTPAASGFRIGFGYAGTTEWGTPDFDFDRMFAGNTIFLRGDYVKGPYKVRYLAKFDTDKGAWYDHEWEFALVAGSLEPYVQVRQVPDELRIGVRFRIEEFARRVSGK